MSQVWRPTAPGKLFTKSVDWRLTLDDDQFELVIQGRRLAGPATFLERLSIARGTFWATVKIALESGKTLPLDGIPNADAEKLRASVDKTLGVIRHREQVAKFIEEFNEAVGPVVDWAHATRQACISQLKNRGWLSHEFKEALSATKPKGLTKLVHVPEVAQSLAMQPEAVQEAFALLGRSIQAVADGINKRHLAKELVDSREFLNSIEKSPLTQEQAEAVICFDNRVLLVAAAGSGKTSVMVAKAGYAIQKKYFSADRMLLLAFNNDAAAELRQRLKDRFDSLGLPSERIVAKTFHAFGLDVIGMATGKKPSLAPWVESGRDQEALLEMVDELKSTDQAFRASWDLFRLVFGQDLPKFGKEAENPEAWDRESGRDGFWTLNNDVVRSRGELVIANWLFYNGVEYVYEAPYAIDTADPLHRQYRPDFYLPAIDAYLEHWALDANGEPPQEFAGYKEGMAWKKRTHLEHGTRLLETTTAELWSGRAFAYLELELTKLGVQLDPNPDRDVPGRKPIENPRLARTIRSFLTHAKSNRLQVADLRKRLADGVAGQFKFRHDMFLGIFERLWESWERRLKADRCIDFEDMLNMAADCLERGTWNSPYELVMVDEFQDASQARARMVAGLISKPGHYLFAVGDDWQSINRFAGADLSVMTDFEPKFGKTVTLKLETTFRCPQSLCDISSQFIQKNPKQLRKTVRSPKPQIAEPIRIVSVAEESRIRSAIEARVREIAEDAIEGQGMTKVYILGRYRRDEVYQPKSFDATRIEVQFITVHSSKGLEADHVILPRITSETLGFPSRVADDPVLQLAMPSGDSHDFAEERRLFYVALTRAKQTVTLITVAKKESSFVTELVKEHRLVVRNADGTENTSEVCPLCTKGFLVSRKGTYGPFYGCTNYPRCKHTRKIRPDSRGQGTASGHQRRR
ncbi:UvrD-helicase domain-containing protein [Paucibacter soli]|uniref:UvrD-helicase domain-containing protein n=1 Tax=Paucibacter soli TaxID=3133433 RepID=UPI003098F0C0